MKGRCVTQSDTILNKSLLLTLVFVMHWILLHGLQADKQCGELMIASPPVSNGVLRFESNTEVNITFSLINSSCEIKNITQIDISIYTPDDNIFRPQCVIVLIVNNSCRVNPPFAYNMCGCLENAWNYFFTANLSGSIMVKVSADNLMSSILIVNLTSFETSDTTEFTISSDHKTMMATYIPYYYLFLTVGISAGVVIITLIAGLIHFCTLKCDKAQNGTQIEQREYPMNTLSNEELGECVSVECVKRKRNQPDDNSCIVRCTRNKPTDNCHDAEKGKPEKCLTPGYLNAVPYPEWQKDDNPQRYAGWQKDDNPQRYAEWQKDDNPQRYAEWQKDDNHQIDKHPLSQQIVRNASYDHLNDLYFVTR